MRPPAPGCVELFPVRWPVPGVQEQVPVLMVQADGMMQIRIRMKPRSRAWMLKRTVMKPVAEAVPAGPAVPAEAVLAGPAAPVVPALAPEPVQVLMSAAVPALVPESGPALMSAAAGKHHMRRSHP